MSRTFIDFARRGCTRVGLIALAFFMAGCSWAGSWRAVEVRPPGAPFPIHEMTLDAKGQYTATGLFDAKGGFDGDVHTTTGTYAHGWRTLALSPNGGPRLVYTSYRRLDGSLVMSLKPPGQDREVTAVLSPVKP